MIVDRRQLELHEDASIAVDLSMSEPQLRH
jgi:hypothetical protein